MPHKSGPKRGQRLATNKANKGKNKPKGPSKSKGAK
jgi:hypothetical protein